MAEKSHSGSSRASHVLGGKGKPKSKSSGKKPHSIHVKRGKSGGFMVTHHHEPDETGVAMPSEDHVVPDLNSLHDHIDQAMGDQGPAPATPPPDAGASASVAPAPVAPAGM
jgi:hypothetical protein